MCACSPRQFDAVQARQPDVDEGDGGLIALESLQSFEPVAGFDHLHFRPQGEQQFDQLRPWQRFVFDHQGDDVHAMPSGAVRVNEASSMRRLATTPPPTRD